MTDLIDENLDDIGRDDQQPAEKIAHYNDNSVFVKGLIGMILCIAPAAIIGLILIKLSLDDAKKARTDIKDSPNKYLSSSIKKINSGRIMAYIGLFLFIGEIVTLVAIMSMH